MSDAYQKCLKTHLADFFGVAPSVTSWAPETIASWAPDFCTFEVPPTPAFPGWLYVSCGMNSKNPSQTQTEFAIASPFQTLEHAELMEMIATLSHSRGTPFGLGDVINIGRPWIYGAKADHLQVSLPYPYGPSFENTTFLGAKVSVRWLVPIFASEAAFLRDHDVEALERMFEQNGLDYLDVDRQPVI